MGDYIQIRHQRPNSGRWRRIGKKLADTLSRFVQEERLPKVGCSKCEDGHIKHWKEGGFDYFSEPCECLVEMESIRQSIRLKRIANLSDEMLKQATFEDWYGNEFIDFEGMLDFLWIEKGERTTEWLYLYGQSGSGKTYMAMLFAKIALLRELSVFFISVPEMLERLRPNEDDPSDRQRVKKMLKRCDLLILDDIGQEKASQWVREQLYIYINSRYGDGKRIIFTSNFDVSKLRDTISVPVYSRVVGKSICIPVNGEDKRLNN